ncbi:MAG: hypothetical protein A2W93_15335 [Bacteroidetes bacterium GWF2_43_63]|nr:MAG: hypothetical protein A2W94_05105 [Bacteroidetes bacterium GWE2_42_42]OFY53394.1 MAG: hypothetical protein A2W93_15335 [Bacteroidetes bacterium GWF2_43_63]HBG69435.1 hypothetical protein [Bacteroidales bacterium]HCB62054.1 hypothetical protein [Bacteroidales bacterium]HCY23110.1 hypothetical protein [Bacteroidales bacterium]
MPETSFHTTYSDDRYLLARAENGSQSGLQRRGCHRFGFNGKENDNEVKGTGNQQDYGARIYDNRIGRFLSADPLIVQQQKYPELSPYQFASNTPIQAIDFDGLEAFIIHGSNQNSSRYVFSSSVKNQLMRIGGNSSCDDSFTWDAPLLNKETDRFISALVLTVHVMKTRATMLASGQISENEPVTLIGYSHGGNVAIQAAGFLSSIGINVNLITVATPAYNGKNDSENPANHPGIKNHYSFVHIDDPVQTFAGGEIYYFNNKTENFVLEDKEMNSTGSLVQWKPHTDLPWSEDFAKFLKNVPQMKSDPSNTKVFDEKAKEYNSSQPNGTGN